jgi:hypothetical protein
VTGASEGLLAPLWLHRRFLLPIGVALVFTYGYFVAPPAWNQNSRLALTRALVEDGSIVIDPHHETTGDKSWRDGHFYSDKAPGTSFVATLPYAVLWGVRRATGGELPSVTVHPLDPLDAAAGRRPEPSELEPGDRLVYNLAHRLALWVCGLFAVGIPSVAGAAALFLLALRSSERAGDPPHRARIHAMGVTLLYALGTTAFAYSTVLYGHQLCGAMLVIGFAAVSLSSTRRLQRGPAMLAGFVLGLAVTTEYPAAVPAALIALWTLHRHGAKAAAWLCLGAIPWVVLLGAYHTAAFGGPLSTGYDWVYLDEFADGMRERYGLGWPDPMVLLRILFGQYRGLFYLCPVLLVASWGLVFSMRHGEAATAYTEAPGRAGVRRAQAIVAGIIVAYYLLLNAGYYMWDGGASTGPRHVVPMLPFLALGLCPALRLVPRATWVLGAVSIAQMLLMAAAAPEASQHGNPLWEYALDRVRNRQALPHATATNLGLLLGLPGIFSLMPLVALWAWITPTALHTARPPASKATRERESGEIAIQDEPDSGGICIARAHDRPADDATDEQARADAGCHGTRDA